MLRVSRDKEWAVAESATIYTEAVPMIRAGWFICAAGHLQGEALAVDALKNSWAPFKIQTYIRSLVFDVQRRMIYGVVPHAA